MKPVILTGDRPTGPLHTRRRQYQSDLAHVRAILKEGSLYARAVVARKVQDVKEAMSLVY